jgi:hypothetical protein
LFGSTCARVSVHVPDVLPVALGHFDGFWPDFDELTATLLRCPAAALANRERDLVARAARVLGAFEGLTAEEQDGCVVIERLARVAADFRHRFAKGREDVARELEAEHVALMELSSALGIPLTPIGRVEVGTGVTVLDAYAKSIVLERSGFDHFR